MREQAWLSAPNPCGHDGAMPETRAFRIRLQAEPAIEFEGQAQHSVLEAALAAGFKLASSCRNGTCRACMCQLLSGEIAYRIEWPGLSREEKLEGWMLPCVALPRSDLVLALARKT
jgi:ferredoxin